MPNQPPTIYQKKNTKQLKSIGFQLQSTEGNTKHSTLTKKYSVLLYEKYIKTYSP